MEKRSAAAGGVFILEDDADLAFLIQKNLERSGYKVSVCTDGSKALSAVVDASPDLILLDYQLGKTNGEKILEQLRQAGISLPFIIITGCGDERTAVEMMKLGARDYLIKDAHFIDMLPSVVRKVSEALETEKALEETRAALRKSEERFKLAIEAANEGLYDWDIPSNSVYLSPKLCTQLEYGPCAERPAADAWEPFVHPDDRSKVSALKTALAAGEKDAYQMEFRLKTSSGDWKWIMSRGKVVERDGQGSVRRVVGAHTDITYRKKLEFQLRQAHKMEAAATLAGGVAHEFNNILGIIIGNTELAIDDIPEWNPARRNLDEVIKASLRAKDVVRGLLSFRRKSEGRRKPIKIGPIIEDVLKLIKTSTSDAIDFRKNIPENTGEILAEPSEIHQALVNLCANAVFAMRENGGILEVSVRTLELDETDVSQYTDIFPGRYLSISVSDTGHGIPSEIKGRILEPYFTTREVGEGVGMGLAVVHGVVKSHNGAVSIYSEPGKTTTFKILFPLISNPDKNESPVSESIPGGAESLLLVDDEAGLLELGKSMLERLGYRVTVQSNPVQALALFKSRPHTFDLVVTDMTMPGMTGAELAREIKATRPEIPVILCTGFSEQIDSQKARALGISKYIEKPLNMREFAVSVRNALDGETL